MISANKKMMVGICGGGPAGGALALCLGRLGCFQVTVLESRPNLEGGYKIDFRGKAIDAFRRMGIYELIQKIQTNYKESMVTVNGSYTVKMESNALGARKGEDLEVMRGLFCQAIYKAAEQTKNVIFKFGQSIQNISEHSDGVQVRLKNGEKYHFDILVGADGLHSQVRKCTFEQSQGVKHKLGVGLCYVHLPESFLLNNEEEVQFIGCGRFVEVFNIPEQGTIAAFAFSSSDMDENCHRDIDALKKFLIKDFGRGDVCWEMMPQLLEAIQKTPNEHFHFSEATQIRMPNWSKGRVVLIGDAAACPSPLTGQGGSFAVLSGYILAQELFKSSGDYKIAFPAYQQALCKFVQKNQELADINTEIIKDGNSLKARIIHWCMNHVPAKFISYVQRWMSCRIQQAANAVELGENFLSQR